MNMRAIIHPGGGIKIPNQKKADHKILIGGAMVLFGTIFLWRML